MKRYPNCNSIGRYLLLAILLLSPALPLYAHDPGLSKASVQLYESQLAINMAFSNQDLEAAISMDFDQDGAISIAEFTASKSKLEMLFTTEITARQTGKTLIPKSVSIDSISDDAVNVALFFDHRLGKSIELDISLLERLPRGHRQYLVIQDQNGELISQHIVNAESQSVEIKSAGRSDSGVFLDYVYEGVWHIWVGFDHILFLLTLLLPAVLVYREHCWESLDRLHSPVSNTLKVVTAFTLAHSLTLALAVQEIVVLPSKMVESVIAFSVIVTAINNLWPVVSSSRWVLAFVFGLIHGFGFAGVLAELGLPEHALLVSLLGFNLGVELGQIAIVAIVLPLAYLSRNTQFYRTWVFGGGSTMAAVIATVWVFERIIA